MFLCVCVSRAFGVPSGFGLKNNQEDPFPVWGRGAQALRILILCANVCLFMVRYWAYEREWFQRWSYSGLAPGINVQIICYFELKMWFLVDFLAFLRGSRVADFGVTDFEFRSYGLRVIIGRYLVV